VAVLDTGGSNTGEMFQAMVEELRRREAMLAAREHELAQREIRFKTILALTETARRQLVERLEEMKAREAADARDRAARRGGHPLGAV